MEKSDLMIYMDNASTTKPYINIMENLPRLADEFFANPSSLHNLGLEAEREIKKVKKIISKVLNVGSNEIFFTSGATEANNLAIQGCYAANKRSGKHIITTKTEHPSVIEAIKKLEELGANVTYLPVCEKGYINLEQLESTLRDDTILVSIMHVNNETGTINDIEKISKIVKNKNAIMHCDGVQGFLKHSINLKNVDIYTFSAHKVHGLKGTGGLFIKKGTKLSPIFFGGSQESGIRVGTENTLSIISLGMAVEKFIEMSNTKNTIIKVREKIMAVANEYSDIYINGDGENGSPYILNISFNGVKAEVLLHALESHNIYVSTGSACSSKKTEKMLDHYGYSKERVSSSLRFSFSSFTTLNEAEYCVQILKKQVQILKKINKS